jgi:hypothetical protein
MAYTPVAKALANKVMQKFKKKPGLANRMLKKPGTSWVQRRPGVGAAGARRVDIAAGKAKQFIK